MSFTHEPATHPQQRPAAGRTAWTADCPDYANLFDGSASTRTNFTDQNDNVVTIDMKSTHMVTGIDLNSAGISSVSFEYSTDGQTFLTAGTPASNEYATSGSDRYIAFYVGDLAWVIWQVKDGQNVEIWRRGADV